MRLKMVQDCSMDEMISKDYDLAFFCSSFETRCTTIPKELESNSTLIKKTIILGHASDSEELPDQRRVKNDTYFEQHWTSEVLETKSTDYVCIFKILNEHFNKEKGMSLFIDYTAMSRIWLSSILTWLKHNDVLGEVTVDFAYSIGANYKSAPQYTVKNFFCLPGYEGKLNIQKKSTAIIGLGFDKYSPLWVFDNLEPDETYIFIASPAIKEDYVEVVKNNNKMLIEASQNAPLELSIRSVEDSFKRLSELISSQVDSSNITFVPMGPKPFSLTTLLVILRFEEVACMNIVRNKHEVRNDVLPSGEFISTRITFK